MEFLQFWDQHRGSFSHISPSGGSYSYAPANRSWSGSFQNLGFGALVSRNCRTLSQIDSPRLLVWIDVIDLSQQFNEFLHFRFFTNSFILHHSSSIIYHLIIYQASALIYHVIHHLSPSIYHLPCIMYTSAFISHPFAPSPQASGVIPELSALAHYDYHYDYHHHQHHRRFRSQTCERNLLWYIFIITMIITIIIIMTIIITIL